MDMLPADSSQAGLWVFAYGSLMWRPGFDYDEIRGALLRCYHRGLCIFSYQYRGTPDRPGLVFGLDRGGRCQGRVLRIPPGDINAVVRTLYDREMISRAYVPQITEVETPAGGVRALTFIADRNHEQYCGSLADEETVRLIKQGVGHSGTCLDYVKSTVLHLRELGIRDDDLERLLALSVK